MIMPSLASCDGPAGPARAGEDWKKRGEEDATAAVALAPERVLRGVTSDCLAGVEDCDFRDECPLRREDGVEVDDIVVLCP